MCGGHPRFVVLALVGLVCQGTWTSRFTCHSQACWVGLGPVALYWCGFAISFSFFFIFPSDPRVGDLRLPPAGLPHCLVSARPPLLLLADILHGLAVPSMALSLQLRALPYRSPLQPLGLAALPHSFVKRSPCPPRRARGPCPPPGALPCVPPGGVRGPLSGSGRPSPPWVVEGSPAVAPCGMRLFLLAALLLSPPSSLHPGSEGGPGPLCHASPPAVPTGSPSFFVIFFPPLVLRFAAFRSSIASVVGLFCCRRLCQPIFLAFAGPLRSSSSRLSCTLCRSAMAGVSVPLCPSLRVSLRLCVVWGCACIATPPGPPYGPSRRVFRGVSRGLSAPFLAGDRPGRLMGCCYLLCVARLRVCRSGP